MCKFRWTNAADDPKSLAEFFIRNIGGNYLSPADIIAGRATSVFELSKDFPEVILQEFASIASGNATKQLAVAEAKTLLGLAVVVWGKNCCVIEDFVVECKYRKKGLGKLFIEWIESQARLREAKTILLETSDANTAAHRFFRAQGFTPQATVYAKEI